jgi:hypothetical protein
MKHSVSNVNKENASLLIYFVTICHTFRLTAMLDAEHNEMFGERTGGGAKCPAVMKLQVTSIT